LKAKGATKEEIDEYRGKVRGKSDKTAEEIADEVVKRFVKEKAALDEVKKQLQEKGATAEVIKKYVQQAKFDLHRLDDDTEEFVQNIVRQYEREKEMNEGGAEASDEEAPNIGDGPGMGSEPAENGSKPAGLTPEMMDQIKKKMEEAMAG